jgi:hypothetical protein
LYSVAVSGNVFIEARERQPEESFSRGTVVTSLPDNFGNGFSSFFPKWLIDEAGALKRINLPKPLSDFVQKAGLNQGAIFYLTISIIHAPAYRSENLGALRISWPRVPIPGDANRLRHSATLGETLSTLLNPEVAALGVSSGTLRPGLRVLGVPAKRSREALSTADLALTAGWGSAQNAGGGSVVMPGRGLTKLREYTPSERKALEIEAQALDMSIDELLQLIGIRTLDIYLNANCFWSNVPENVWAYALGGYQVIKKWLSYREFSLLRRALKPEEAAYVSEVVRRIAAILLMGPALDANYRACAADAQTYETLGLSRDAARERADARAIKRGLSTKLTPAMKANREAAKRPRRKLKTGANPA